MPILTDTLQLRSIYAIAKGESDTHLKLIATGETMLGEICLALGCPHSPKSAKATKRSTIVERLRQRHVRQVMPDNPIITLPAMAA